MLAKIKIKVRVYGFMGLWCAYDATRFHIIENRVRVTHQCSFWSMGRSRSRSRSRRSCGQPERRDEIMKTFKVLLFTLVACPA